MSSPCCLAGIPWTRGRVAGTSSPSPYHLPWEWDSHFCLVSSALQQPRALLFFREDHKKPGQFRDLMPLRSDFEETGMDMTDLWGGRLGTWLWSRLFHTQAQAVLPADNHNHSSGLLITLPTQEQQQWAKGQAMSLAYCWSLKKMDSEFTSCILFSVW